MNNKSKRREVYNLKKADLEGLKSSLGSRELIQLVESISDVKNALSLWSTYVMDKVNKYVPKIKLRKRDTPPWIDGEVIHLSNKKETVRKLAKRTNNGNVWARYRKLRNKLKNLITQKHNAFIKESTQSIANNPKRFWSIFRAKTGSPTIPPVVEHNGKAYSTPEEKTNAFNEFFYSVFNQSKIDGDNELPLIYICEDTFLSDLVVNTSQTLPLLQSLDPSKAIGPDNLPTLIIKECAVQLAPSLTSLFNKSLALGQVPDSWKEVNTVPIHKKGEKKYNENYRGISLLPVVSKVFERCLYNYIYPHIRNKLYHFQHGFLKQSSTVTQLLEVTNYLNEALDNNQQTDIVYLDFSKAFDSVPHYLLIHKLKSYGFSGNLLAWFTNYLESRKQRVCIDGYCSRWLPAVSGVPQGSILGPLLFLLYVNDIYLSLSGGTTIALFADDAKIYRKIISLNDCHTLQADLNTLLTWSEAWKMNFKANKCKTMSISRKKNPIVFDYCMRHDCLERVQSFNDLGITVQNNLKWDKHISQTVSKSNKMLWCIIRCLGYKAPMEAKLNAYLSLIRSILEYGSVVWSPIAKINLQIIESVQRRATKYICNYHYQFNPLSYKERLKICNLLPLSYRREILDCVFLYKAIHGLSNVNLENLFTFQGWDAPYQTRNQDPFLIKPKRANTETYMHFYTQRMSSLWNELPFGIRYMPPSLTCSSFKFGITQYYTHLRENFFDTDNICSWNTKCRCSTCRAC